MQNVIIVDGHKYKSWEDVPDFGSIENIGFRGNFRAYHGLAKDLAKLPVYDDLAPGSYCDMLDTAERYVFHRKSKKWYKRIGGGGGGSIEGATDEEIDLVIDDLFVKNFF